MRKSKFIVYYKDWKGEWKKDTEEFTSRSAKATARLNKIKKTKALNGQATLQEV